MRKKREEIQYPRERPKGGARVIGIDEPKDVKSSRVKPSPIVVASVEEEAQWDEESWGNF